MEIKHFVFYVLFLYVIYIYIAEKKITLSAPASAMISSSTSTKNKQSNVPRQKTYSSPNMPMKSKTTFDKPKRSKTNLNSGENSGIRPVKNSNTQVPSSNNSNTSKPSHTPVAARPPPIISELTQSEKSNLEKKVSLTPKKSPEPIQVAKSDLNRELSDISLGI